MALSERKFGVAALACLMVAGLLFLIGYGSNHWLDVSTVHSGLWKLCDAGGDCVGFSGDAVWMSVRAFETLALLGAGAGAVLLILSFLLQKESLHEIIPTLTMVCICGAAGCCILGVIILGATTHGTPGYSFYLTLFGGIGLGVAGILSFIEMRK